MPLRLRVAAGSLRLYERLRELLAWIGGWSLRVKASACGLAAALAAVCGWIAFSGGATIQDVTVVGLSRDASPVVEDDLVSAARGQTAGSFSVATVRGAVAHFSLIEDVRAQVDQANGVTLVVSERPVVARLEVGHAAFPLGAGGSVVTGLARSPHVATIRSRQRPIGGRSSDPWVGVALRILAAAPAPLRRRVVSVTLASDGITIHLHRGPRLIFGDDTLPHAKWDASAAVLADPGSRGASYIDVRVPSRPAAQVGDPATTASSIAFSGQSAGSPLNVANVATNVGSGN